MGILVINEYGRDTREFRIFLDQIRIGRDPRGEIVLRDIGVSRAHARILRQGDQFLLEDLGSRNGTIVNDRKLEEKGTYPLRHGDAIQVGRSVLRFLLRISEKIAQSLRKGVEGSTDMATRPSLQTPDVEPPICLFSLQKITASLVILQEGRTAGLHQLRSDRVRIGRGPGSDIVINDPGVSLDHAEIVYHKEGFFLVDRDSTAGTYLNGAAVRVAQLAPRSFIRFGKVEALFVYHKEGAEIPMPSFQLRDHLMEVYPERSKGIYKAFQDAREQGLDFAEELVMRCVLDPEQWWAGVSGFKERPSTFPHGWISRFFRRG